MLTSWIYYNIGRKIAQYEKFCVVKKLYIWQNAIIINVMKRGIDVLTLLIHLGYLAYDSDTKSVFIPNEEVRQEFIRAVKEKNIDRIF